MDSNFEGTNMEQWQEIEHSPFEVEEVDEFPIPAAEDEEDIATQEEDRKRAEHEASEAKRKAEWEARQQEKKEAELREIYRLDCMPDEEVMVESMQRISKDTERLTRRNMKDCVSEHVQTLCFEDAAFARLAMYPKKSMINCFRYINRKAREFVEQEMKDNDIKPENGVYGSDVPDDLCYQWAEDYFRDPDAPEDKPEKEEKFVPKPYTGKTSSKSANKKSAKKESSKKVPEKTAMEEKVPEDKNTDSKAADAEKDSSSGQISFLDFLMPNTKVG